MSEATTRRNAEGTGAAYEAYQTAEAECLERETPLVKAGPKKMFFSVDEAMVPFLFLLYDSRTKTILFLGRMVNPGQ